MHDIVTVVDKLEVPIDIIGFNIILLFIWMRSCVIIVYPTRYVVPWVIQDHTRMWIVL